MYCIEILFEDVKKIYLNEILEAVLVVISCDGELFDITISFDEAQLTGRPERLTENFSLQIL